MLDSICRFPPIWEIFRPTVRRPRPKLARGLPNSARCAPSKGASDQILSDIDRFGAMSTDPERLAVCLVSRGGGTVIFRYALHDPSVALHCGNIDAVDILRRHQPPHLAAELTHRVSHALRRCPRPKVLFSLPPKRSGKSSGASHGGHGLRNNGLGLRGDMANLPDVMSRRCCLLCSGRVCSERLVEQAELVRDLH